MTALTPALIMAVPWQPERAQRAHKLREQTGGTIVWDGNRNAFDTWRSQMMAAGPHAVICMEDDVLLADRWRERVEAAIAERPDTLIQFFSMRPKADLTVGSRYEPGATYLMNQCYYLPAGFAADLYAYSEGWQEQHPEHPSGCDTVIAHWLRDTGRRYWVHVPSLVQHVPWRSVINPRRPRNRQSPTFEGAGQ